MSTLRCTVLSILVVVSFGLGLFPNTSALPTPGFFGPEAEAITGRVFPEAMETNDYVGFWEALDGLAYLEQQYPGWVTVKEAGKSYGLINLVSQEHDTFTLPIVEVTNPDSAVPYENKVQVLFMLSIHGNEKGGREGGLRVIEDFAKDIGMAQWPQDNGAGSGTYRDYLDYMTLIFLFPNPDGWVHDEPEYLTGSAQVEPTEGGVNPNCANGVVFYCRTNGRGVDINREVPTMGWYRERYTALSEPESQGYANYILQNYHNLVGATDIHGMLNDEHYVLTLIPAAGMDPQEMTQTTRMAEMLKERLNTDAAFDAWRNAFQAAETAAANLGIVTEPAGEALCDVHFAGCLVAGDNPAHVAGSSEINEWGTVWDTIGYTDSGFNGDWFAQNSGLDAPGFDIELAYNHLTFDSQYELGMYFNELHVQSVRQIVAVFMDAMSQDLQTSIEVHGTRTAVLANPTVVTNVDDEQPLDGWAMENEWDDSWDYANNDFFAAPQDYFREMKPYLKDGDVPAVFDELNKVDLTAKKLEKYDNLIIPGSAYDTILGDAAAVSAIQAWTEAGGNLVLTDSALRMLEAVGLASEGGVEELKLYAGYTNFFDRSHDMVSNVRGIARQTYEPVPLGFSIEANAAPNWVLKTGATDAALDTMGWVGAEDTINLGELPLGEGTVRFIGSLLPDPSEEFYHPYGLEPYATTYSGNQLLRNFLGWEQVFEAPPALVTDAGISYTPPLGERALAADDDAIEDETTPGLGSVVLVLGLIGLLAVTRRRR